MRHHVTQQLMRWFNVLFVEFFPTGETGDREWSSVNDRLLIFRPVLSHSLPGRLYANDPITHSLINRRYVKKIVDEVENISADKVLLFNFVYHLPEVMRQGIFCYKAYVCFDEFPKMQRRTYKRNPLKAKYQEILFQHYENQVAREANHCFTPHYPLRDKLLKVNKNVEMLLHAHSCILESTETRQNKDGRIKVAFAGYIHYRLIDKWLKRVLNEEDMDLYLIGPHNPAYDVGQFKECPNFYLVPPLEEYELIEKMREMDVLIIPYHPHLPEVEVLTTASKLYQYIVSGKPIVTSNLPNLIELPESISQKATSADDFISKIRIAYKNDCDEYRKLRSEIATENTWDKRGEQLYGILKNILSDIAPDFEVVSKGHT
jgi:hypothetical protein